MSPYGINPRCPTCDRLLPEREPGKGGAPKMYCDRRCSLVNFHLDKVLGYILAMQGDDEIDNPALLAIRQRLWLAGNALTPRGRKPGTVFLRLWLECGHTADIRRRHNRVDGVMMPRRAPGRSRCPDCNARRAVMSIPPPTFDSCLAVSRIRSFPSCWGL